jgi:hypothetical protein
VALVAAAVVLVLAVVAALVHQDRQSAADPAPPPAASTGVGETSPSAAPSDAPTPGLVPLPSDGPSPSETAGAAPCPVGSPFSRQDHPQDGRVHGGGLSFPQQPGWTSPGPQASVFTWAYDLGETDIQLEQTRYASYAVGAVSVADGFEDPRSAARLAMRCTVESALYSNVSNRTDLVDQETTVNGYPAWTVRSEIRTYDARTSYQGDTVQITVVDLGTEDALAFFWGSAPVGDATFTARLDQVARQLKVG